MRSNSKESDFNVNEMTTTMRLKFIAAVSAVLMFATSLTVAAPTASAAPPPDATEPIGNGQTEISTDSIVGIATVRPQLPGLAGGELIASIDLNYTAPLSPNSFAGFEISELPAGVKFASAEPKATTGQPGWSCDTNKCSWAVLGSTGEIRPAQIGEGAHAQGWIRFSVAADSPAVLDMPTLGSTGLDSEALEPPTMKISATVDGQSVEMGDGESTGDVPVFATVAGTDELLTLNYRTKGAGRVGETVSMDVNLVNNGAVKSSSSILVSQILAKDFQIASLKISGDSWSCDKTSSSLGTCVYSESLAPGDISNTLTLTFEIAEGTSTVKSSTNGVTGDAPASSTNSEGQIVPAEGRFPLAAVIESPQGRVVMQIATAELYFSVFEAGRPDLAVTSVTPTTSIVAGEPITISTSVVSNSGPTKEPINVHIGLKGAQFVSQKGALSDCSTSSDGVDCEMAPLKMGEDRQIDVTIIAPETIDDDKAVESVSVSVSVTTPNEMSETLSDNNISNNLPIGLAFSPTAALQPAELGEDGLWHEFNGATIQVAPEGDTTFGFVVRNIGGKEFTETQTFEVEIAAADDVAITGTGDGWACVSEKVKANSASDSAIEAAGQSVEALNVALDPSQAKSDFERQILQQVASQIPTKQVAERSSKNVNGIRCTYTTTGEMAVNVNTPAIVVTVTPTADPVTPGDVWSATLTSTNQPPIEFPVVRRSERPLAVPVLQTPELRPTGTGIARLMVRNTGTGALNSGIVMISSTAGVQFDVRSIESTDWDCVDIGSLIGGVALCHSGSISAGGESSVLDVPVSLKGDVASDRAVRGIAFDGRIAVSSASRVASVIKVLPALAVSASTVRAEVNDITPGVDLQPAPTEVVLSADANGEANYSWRQLCTTEGEVGCDGVSPIAEIRQTGSSSATALMPNVDEPTKLTFEVSAESAGSTATSKVSFTVIPTPGINAPAAEWETDAGLDPALQPEVNPNTLSGPSRQPHRLMADPEPPSQEVINRGISGAPSRIASVRGLEGLSVRANVTGVSTSVDIGSSTTFVSAASSGATFAWEIVGGATSLTTDATISQQVADANSTISINIPVEGVTPGDSLVLKVVATSNGHSAADTLTLTVAGADGVAQPQVVDASPSRPVIVKTGGNISVNVFSLEGSETTVSIGDESVANASVTGGQLSISGTAVGATSLSVISTTTTGASAITIPVVVVAQPRKIDFCSDADEAVVAEFARVLGEAVDTSSWFGPTSSPCLDGYALFNNAQVTIDGISIADAGGYVVPSGIAVTVGTGTGPESYGAPVISLNESGPFYQFRSEGTFAEPDGVMLVDVPEDILNALKAVGGESSGKLKISAGKVVGVTFSATGAPAENGEAASFVATGSVNKDETLELEVSPADIPAVLGGLIKGVGRLTKSKEGVIETTVQGSLIAPIQLAAGITIDSGSFTVGNSTLSGSGKVSIQLGSSKFTFDGSFEQTEAKFAVTVSQQVDTFTAIEGLVLTNATVTGSLELEKSAVSGSITASADAIDIGGGLATVSDVEFEFGVSCPESGDCDVKGKIKAAVSIPVGDSPVTTEIEGTFNTEDGSWEASGSLADVPLATDVVLKQASIKVGRSAEGEFAIEAEGQIDLFGTSLYASVKYDEDRAVLTASLANVALFGKSGPTLTAGEIVYVNQAAEPFAWDPAGDALDTAVEGIQLTQGDIRIAALVALPAELVSVRDALGGSFTLPTAVSVVGFYNLETGAADLAVGATGGSIGATGRFVRESSDADWSWDISLTVSDPIAIVEQLSIQNLNVTVSNHDGTEARVIGDVTIKASGAARLTFGETNIDLGVELNFESSTKFDISVTGSLDTLQIVDGFTITGVEVSGTLNRDGDALTGTLNFGATDITFAGGTLVLTDPKFALETNCDLAEDGDGCTFNISLASDIALVIADQTISGSLGGTYNSEKKEFEFTGSLNKIDFGGGVTLNEANLKINWSADSGFAVNADATATIFETEVGASIEFSEDKVVVVFDLANLELIPDTGLRVVAGTVVYVAKAAEAITWAPKNPVLAARVGTCVADTKINAESDAELAKNPESEEVTFDAETKTVSDEGASNEDDAPEAEAGSKEESADNPSCGVTLESGTAYAAAIIGLPSLFADISAFTRGSITLPTDIFVGGLVNFDSGALAFQVSAVSDTFNIGGVVQRASSEDDVQWRVSLAYTGEILLAGDQVKFKDINFAVGNLDADSQPLDSVQLRAGGALFIDLPGSFDIDLNAKLVFEDTDNWSITVEQGLGDPDQNGGMWQLFPGFSLPAGQISGTVGMDEGNLSANLSVQQLAPWVIINVADSSVTVNALTLTIGLTCTDGTSDCSPSFTLGGTVNATILGTVLPTLTLEGGFADDTWFFEVSIGEFEVIDGLTITGASFRIEYGDTFAVELTGAANIMGVDLTAFLRFSSEGVLFAAGASDWEMFSGGPVFEDVAFVWSTYATNYTLPGGTKLAVKNGSLMLVAAIATPDSLEKAAPGLRFDPIVIDVGGILSGNLSLRFGLSLPDNWWIFDVNGFGVRVSNLAMEIGLKNFEPTIAFNGTAVFKTPDSPNGVPLTLRLAITPQTLSISITLGIDPVTKAEMPWNNAFGIPGFKINYLAGEIGINWTTTPIPLPQFGMAMSIELPTFLRDLLGTDQGVRIDAAFKFANEKSCIQVKVGEAARPGQTSSDLKKAVNIGGVFIANYFEFTYAPLGCSVGDVSVPAGIKLGFAGRIAGISVIVQAAIDVTKLEISAYINIDAINLGPVRLKQTYLDLLLSATSPTSSHLNFTGGMELDLPSGTAVIDAKVAIDLGTGQLAFRAVASRLVLMPGVLEVKNLKAEGLISITSLVFYLHADLDVLLFGTTAKGQATIDIDSGGVKNLSMNFDSTMAIGPLAANAKFAFAYAKGGYPMLNFNGSMRVSGTDLAQVSGEISSEQMTFLARANVANIFNGEIQAKVVLCNRGAVKITNKNGALVTGQLGDFYASATLGMNMGILQAQGTVKMGYSSSTTAEPYVNANCPNPQPTLQNSGASQQLTQVLSSVIPTTTVAATTTTRPVNAVTTTTRPVVVATTTTTTTRPPSVTSTTVRANVATTTSTTTIPKFDVAVRYSEPQYPATFAQLNVNQGVTPTVPAGASRPALPREFFFKINANGSLNLGTVVTGTATLDGNVDSSGNVSFAISGNVSLAGFAQTALSGTYARQADGKWTLQAQFSANVADLATVAFSGYIRNQSGDGTVASQVQYDLNGNAAVDYKILKGNASFKATNVGKAAGVYASLGFASGVAGVAKVSGSMDLAFTRNRFYFNVEASLDSFMVNSRVWISGGTLSRNSTWVGRDPYTVNSGWPAYRNSTAYRWYEEVITYADSDFWVWAQTTGSLFTITFQVTAQWQNNALTVRAVSPSNFDAGGWQYVFSLGWGLRTHCFWCHTDIGYHTWYYRAELSASNSNVTGRATVWKHWERNHQGVSDEYGDLSLDWNRRELKGCVPVRISPIEKPCVDLGWVLRIASIF